MRVGAVVTDNTLDAVSELDGSGVDVACVVMDVEPVEEGEWLGADETDGEIVLEALLTPLRDAETLALTPPVTEVETVALGVVLGRRDLELEPEVLVDGDTDPVARVERVCEGDTEFVTAAVIVFDMCGDVDTERDGMLDALVDVVEDVDTVVAGDTLPVDMKVPTLDRDMLSVGDTVDVMVEETEGRIVTVSV